MLPNWNSVLSQELQRKASLRSFSAETESGSVSRSSSDSGNVGPTAASTGGAMTRTRASSITLISGRSQESGDGHDSASDGVLPADSCVMS